MAKNNRWSELLSEHRAASANEKKDVVNESSDSKPLTKLVMGGDAEPASDGATE